MRCRHAAGAGPDRGSWGRGIAWPVDKSAYVHMQSGAAAGMDDWNTLNPGPPDRSHRRKGRPHRSGRGQGLRPHRRDHRAASGDVAPFGAPRAARVGRALPPTRTPCGGASRRCEGMGPVATHRFLRAVAAPAARPHAPPAVAGATWWAARVGRSGSVYEAGRGPFDLIRQPSGLRSAYDPHRACAALGAPDHDLDVTPGVGRPIPVLDL